MSKDDFDQINIKDTWEPNRDQDHAASATGEGDRESTAAFTHRQTDGGPWGVVPVRGLGISGASGRNNEYHELDGKGARDGANRVEQDDIS